jgi:hypothetical protein
VSSNTEFNSWIGIQIEKYFQLVKENEKNYQKIDVKIQKLKDKVEKAKNSMFPIHINSDPHKRSFVVSACVKIFSWIKAVWNAFLRCLGLKKCPAKFRQDIGLTMEEV